MAKCMRVERQDAEKERKKLSLAGALDNSYVPARGRKFVYFPVNEGAKLPSGAKLVEKKLERRSERPKTLREALAGKLSAAEMEELVTSFDLMGDIAVVEVPGELAAKEKLIASALMSAHHNVRVVAKKISGTAGEFRIRPVQVIAGEKRTHTIYREGGCEFELDINKAYFSPRLGTERGRLCELVKQNEQKAGRKGGGSAGERQAQGAWRVFGRQPESPKGEHVLVPFAGVGPFAIRMGKAATGAEVVGIELNPGACYYFERNVARNKCANVRAVRGDVAALLPGKYKGWADRLAMPLPKDGKKFLANAIPCLKKGGMLHYYSFGSVRAPFAEAERDVLQAAVKCGRKARVVFRRVVRPYSKDTEQVVIDAKIG